MFLVTGATGNVGSELVATLVQNGSEVRALVRRPGAALPAGAQAVVGDLDEPESLSEALAGVAALFLLPGYADMPGLLARARDAGVERVVLLSGGSAAHEDLANAVSRYMTLSERAVRDSGLPWTFLRPRAFMSNALRWLPQLQTGNTVQVQFPKVALACVDPADIGAVAARALAGGHDGRIYDLTGPEALRPAEQVAVLARALGRDLACVELSDDETRTAMEGASIPPQYIEAFFSFYVDGTLDETTVHQDVPEILGRPARTFEQWANAHVADFARA
jgi:uncharacterized protein YbjT (DUF2867 family)